MNHLPNLLFSSLLLAPVAMAQGGQFLFTTMQPEITLSGSTGTVLRQLRPNEITAMEFGASPCASQSAEKWAPRSVFHTQAGDTDGDDLYFEPNLFGRIDGILAVQTAAVGMPNQRSIYYSVSAPMATAISGAPGLRPGDIGRIVRNGVGDGQVEYFLRAEQVQLALGLPVAPVMVNVDACAAGPNYGVFFSIEDDTPCNLLTGGAVMVRDGDVLLIPAGALTWSGTGTVAAVMPGSALVVHNEGAMDGFVANAMVNDRNGACVTQVVDTDALEIDWANPFAFPVPTAYGIVAWAPNLLFAGESLTGASVLTTNVGGQIANALCGPLGTPCGGGPTYGMQMGLRAPSAAQGVASSINALCSTRVFRFVTEPVVPQIPVGSNAVLDIGSPNALNWVFMTFAPSGPAVVAPSANFAWGTLGYPDFYPAPAFVGVAATPTGFGTFTGPVIPFACDLIFQAVTITPWGTIEISTPSTIEVF